MNGFSPWCDIFLNNSLELSIWVNYYTSRARIRPLYPNLINEQPVSEFWFADPLSKSNCFLKKFRIVFEMKFLKMLLHVPASCEPLSTCLTFMVPYLQMDTSPVILEQVLCLGTSEPLFTFRTNNATILCCTGDFVSCICEVNKISVTYCTHQY